MKTKKSPFLLAHAVCARSAGFFFFFFFLARKGHITGNIGRIPPRRAFRRVSPITPRGRTGWSGGQTPSTLSVASSLFTKPRRLAHTRTRAIVPHVSRRRKLRRAPLYESGSLHLQYPSQAPKKPPLPFPNQSERRKSASYHAARRYHEGV